MYEKLVELLQATTQKINSKACVFEQKTEVELLRDEYLPPLSLNYVVCTSKVAACQKDYKNLFRGKARESRSFFILLL